MNYRRLPGVGAGIRLVVLGGLTGFLAGLVVGAIIWGDDEYWAELAIFVVSVIGLVGGAVGGLCLWLVRLWRVRAPLAISATVGAACPLVICAVLGLGPGQVGWWLFLGATLAAPGAFAAASIHAALLRGASRS